MGDRGFLVPGSTNKLVYNIITATLQLPTRWHEVVHHDRPVPSLVPRLFENGLGIWNKANSNESRGLYAAQCTYHKVVNREEVSVKNVQKAHWLDRETGRVFAIRNTRE